MIEEYRRIVDSVRCNLIPLPRRIESGAKRTQGNADGIVVRARGNGDVTLVEWNGG